MASRIIFTIMLFVASSCGANQSHHVEKNVYLSGMAAEAVVELEVDGQPITLKKHVGCEAHNYMKAGVDAASEIRSIGIAASQQLPTGEYVVAAMPTTCHRTNRVADETGNLMPKGYLPWIAIFDKGPVPDKVIVYASARAYKASGARIKFNGVSLRHRSISTSEKIDFPKADQFDWFFRGPGRKGRGPYYNSYLLTTAIMIPELRSQFDKHMRNETGIVTLHNGRTNWDHAWYTKFMNDTIGQNERGNYIPRRNLVFPPHRSINFNNSVAGSSFETISSSFMFDDKHDWNSKRYTLINSPAYEGMRIYYRIPADIFERNASTSKKEHMYILPTKEAYLHNANDHETHYIYSNSTSQLFIIGGSYHATPALSGEYKKYNAEQITY